MSHDSGTAVHVLPGRSGAAPNGRVGDLHFRNAEEALRRGEYERAAAEFTYCIQLSPTRADAFARRGDVWRALGRLDAAFADYSAALQSNPRNEAVLFSRGQLHALSGRYRPAISDFTDVLAISLENATAYLSRGQAHSRLGEMVPAITDFTRAIELAPGNAMAFVERGIALLARGDATSAIADFTRANQLNPYLWLAHARRADAYLALGQPEQAASDLSEALRLDPVNPELLASRGNIRLILGAPDAAKVDFDEAVNFSPNDPALFAHRARALKALNKLEDAERDLSESLRLKPLDPQYLLARAEIRLAAGRLDPALSDYVETARRVPESGPAYHGQSLVYIARDDYAMAIPSLDRAIECAPKFADAYFQRARCRARLEKVEEAIDDANRAIELDPESVPIRRLRADLFLRVNRPEEAFGDLAQLVNLAPEDPIVYHLRGKLEFRRGRLDAAIQDLSIALKLDPKFTEALADRAGVFRGLGKHREALFDLTTAVQQDPKYSAEYLVQRGIVHGATGEFNRAIADFLVAQQLDPTNKAATRGKELVTQLRDARGPNLTDSAEHDLDRQAEAERVLSGGKRGRSWRSLIEPDEFAVERPPAKRSGRRQLQRAVEPDVDLAASPDDESFNVAGGFDDEQSDLTVEERDLVLHERTATAPPPRKLPAKRREPVSMPTEVDLEAHELPSSTDSAPPSRTPMPPVQAFSSPAAPPPPRVEPAKAWPKKKRKEDPDERAARIRKYRRYGIIAVGGLFILYYGITLGYSLLPASENPFTEYTAEEFVDRYAKDSAAADEKFADKRICVRGKIKIAKDKTSKAAGKIYFDVAGHKDDMKVELQFGGEDVPVLTDGQEYRINGKPSRFKPGAGIILKDSNIMPLQGSAQATRRDLRFAQDRVATVGERAGHAPSRLRLGFAQRHASREQLPDAIWAGFTHYHRTLHKGHTYTA